LFLADGETPIHVLHRLVSGGHSVVVIEHDLDVMAEADWAIDLGPDGGSGGGQVMVAAPPQAVVRLGTHTGKAPAPALPREAKDPEKGMGIGDRPMSEIKRA